jgi:hypothetical protein
MGGPQPLRDQDEPLLVAVDEHQVAAPGRQLRREGLADPAGGAGDDGGAAGELVGTHQAAAFPIEAAGRRGWKVMPSSSRGPRRISATSRM